MKINFNWGEKVTIVDCDMRFLFFLFLLFIFH